MTLSLRPPRQHGFTLMEVLVALGILGLMMGVVFGSFVVGTRSWQKGEQHLGRVERMAMVQNFFRKQLTAAWNQSELPAQQPDGEQDKIRAERGEEMAFFQGDQQSLQFVSLLPDSAARGGWHLFKVGLASRSGSLVVETLPFLPLRGNKTPESDSVEILSEVESFSLAYWGRKPDEKAPAWHQQWQEIPALPELLSIAIKPRGEAPWPTIVVAPRLAPVLSATTQ